MKTKKSYYFAYLSNDVAIVKIDNEYYLATEVWREGRHKGYKIERTELKSFEMGASGRADNNTLYRVHDLSTRISYLIFEPFPHEYMSAIAIADNGDVDYGGEIERYLYR